MFKKKASKAVSNMRHVITKINPKSPISEQYRTLRTNIQFSSIDEKIKTLLITSSEPGAGKSMTAANLAGVYAQQGLKTLLIDGDMRKPTVHYTFRLGNIRGLSNALVDGVSFSQVAEKTDVDNLSVITCGPIPPNPSELLSSNRFKQLLEEAHESYDMVIIDSPPLLAVTDAKILANMVDGVIIVARYGKTDNEQVKEAVERIKINKDNLLGVVLNGIEKSESYDYYYYS